MAKLATQRVVFQLSKAVSNEQSDSLDILSDEALEQLLEAVSALADDNGVIVELIEG